MAKTLSNMLPLGTKAPAFALPDAVTNQYIHLVTDIPYAATVIMFICNHCPFVKHVNNALIKLANDYIPKSVRFLSISSNDASQYPEDSFENMAKVARTLQYPFPYLYDETQEVAIAYQAACTPDFFVFDKNFELAYRGQLDDSRPGNGKPVTGAALRTALDQILANKPVSDNQMPSMGCNIKWVN